MKLGFSHFLPAELVEVNTQHLLHDFEHFCPCSLIGKTPDLYSGIGARLAHVTGSSPVGGTIFLTQRHRDERPKINP